MDDAIFSARLVSGQLFFGDLRAEVDGEPTRARKASCFLDRGIKPSLEDDDGDVDIRSLLRLLGVMEGYSPVLKRLATKIKRSLGE